MSRPPNRRTSWLVLGIVVTVLTGCRRIPLTWEDATSGTVVRLEPDSTTAGVAFRAEADGVSALTIIGRNLPPDAVVFWNDRPLKTASRGDRAGVVASVPDDIYQTQGTNRISLRTAGGTRISGELRFVVYPQTADPPKLTALYPASAVAGVGFNPQPDGESALGISGNGFLPGVVMLLDGAAMRTVFGASSSVSAAIPAALVENAGTHEVWAVNPDGKASNKLRLTITGK